MNKGKSQKKETLNFRVSAEFKRRLAEEAAKERRSLTNYLEITLTRLWDDRQANVIKAKDAKKT
jgi:predicted HicB family RNase H-like nuclease